MSFQAYKIEVVGYLDSDFGEDDDSESTSEHIFSSLSMLLFLGQARNKFVFPGILRK